MTDADAQKILQFDIKTGKLLRAIHLGEDVLPPGANMNDIRRDKGYLYLTDSGLGGIVVVDLATGKGMRRLNRDWHTLANTKRLPIGEDGRIQRDGKGDPVQVHTDLIEVSPGWSMVVLPAADRTDVARAYQVAARQVCQ